MNKNKEGILIKHGQLVTDGELVGEVVFVMGNLATIGVEDEPWPCVWRYCSDLEVLNG